MNQILLSCISLLLFIILIKVLKIKVNNFVNIALLAYVSIFLTIYVFNSVISIFIPDTFMTIGGPLALIYYIFYAGISEESSKFIATKLSKPKTKSQIIISSILIALLFGIIENYAYYAKDLSTQSIFIRFFDMHILFGAIMGYLLVLGEEKNNKSFRILALIIPIIIHGIWDYSNGTISKIDFLIGGIICYAAMIFMLVKAKKYQETENAVVTSMTENHPVESVAINTTESQAIYPVANEVVQNQVIEASKVKQKDKYFIPKIIALILLTSIWLFAYSNHDSRTKIGQVCEYNNFEMKVIEAENKTTPTNTKYIRVKVNVKNKNSNPVKLGFMSFKLVRLDNGESIIANLSLSLQDDSKELDYKIEANGETEGYLFFEVEGKVSEYKLTYSDFDSEKVCNMNIS